MSEIKQDPSQKGEEQTMCDINQLAQTMTKGIRRWEKVIYPMMFAFIILAAYGFWLIFNLAKDMHNITTNMVVMTRAVVTMTNTMNRKLNNIDSQMVEMNHHMASIEGLDKNMNTIAAAVHTMNTSLINMDNTLTNMYRSVYYMGNSTSSMSSNLSELNHNISAPMNSMNSMIPWSSMPGSSHHRNIAPPPIIYQRRPMYAAPYRAPSTTTQPSTSTPKK